MSETKQLKKNDFLAVVTEEPMTREQLVDALDEFSFISSYLDFLVDHFESKGRIIKNDDGTIQRKGKRAAGPRTVYAVTKDDNGAYAIDSMEVTGNLTNEQKEAGWSETAKAAVKKAKSEVFAKYKDATATLSGLLDA